MLQCPWCWEFIDLYFPADTHGELVEDCEVCCRPWLVSISTDETGERMIHIERSN